MTVKLKKAATLLEKLSKLAEDTCINPGDFNCFCQRIPLKK